MVKNKNGHIINIGSIAGKEVYPKGNVYCASKFAVDAISQGMRIDLNNYNIKVSQINPGLVKTDFAKALWENPEILKQSTATCPMKRIGEPDEIGGAAVFLASQAGSFVNGHTLVIDGGTVA